MAAMMFKLTDKDRALLAGGDASLWLHLKTRLLSREDSVTAEEFEALRVELPKFRDLPEYFAWDSLAEEMKANVLVAVEAGEAVGPRRMPVALGWRAGLAFACLAVLMVSGYWWRIPQRLATSTIEAPVVLEAGPGTVSVEQSENAFAVVFDGTAGQQTLSGGLGSVRADFVDRETGQLTVAHVYLD